MSLKFLVEKGFDVNYKDKNYNTSLHYACDHESYACAKLLIESRIDINAKNKEGKTVLDSKFLTPHIKKLLIKNGAKSGKNL